MITLLKTPDVHSCLQEERHLQPRVSHKLTSLKAICSTGSPLVPHSYDYVYRYTVCTKNAACRRDGTDGYDYVSKEVILCV